MSELIWMEISNKIIKQNEIVRLIIITKIMSRLSDIIQIGIVERNDVAVVALA